MSVHHPLLTRDPQLHGFDIGEAGARQGSEVGQQRVEGVVGPRDLRTDNITAAVAYGIVVGQRAISDVLLGIRREER